jgi:DNA-directed RNA polymerase subunit K/omega
MLGPFGDSLIMDSTLPQRLQRNINGSFSRTVLLQKRIRQLVRGDAPLFDAELERMDNPIEIALTEIERGLIELVEEQFEEKPTL